MVRSRWFSSTMTSGSGGGLPLRPTSPAAGAPPGPRARGRPPAPARLAALRRSALLAAQRDEPGATAAARDGPPGLPAEYRARAHAEQLGELQPGHVQTVAECADDPRRDAGAGGRQGRPESDLDADRLSRSAEQLKPRVGRAVRRIHRECLRTPPDSKGVSGSATGNRTLV